MVVRAISLYGGRVTLVDERDYDSLIAYRWGVNGDGYVYRREWVGSRRVFVQLHRQVLAAPVGIQVDHIDRDRLNNTRANLRLADPFGNAQNRSKTGLASSSRFKGVTLHRDTGKWQAHLKAFGRYHYLGLFESEIAAAEAYDRAAVLHFGEFAATNGRLA